VRFARHRVLFARHLFARHLHGPRNFNLLHTSGGRIPGGRGDREDAKNVMARPRRLLERPHGAHATGDTVDTQIYYSSIQGLHPPPHPTVPSVTDPTPAPAQRNAHDYPDHGAQRLRRWAKVQNT